jgi:hypothetical protein
VPESLVLSFDLTRDDYLAAVRLLLVDSPDLERVARQHRAKALKALWWIAPFPYVMIYLLTRREQVEIGIRLLTTALLGTLVSGMYGWYCAQLSTYLPKIRKAYWEHAQRTDVSTFCGPNILELTPAAFIARSTSGATAFPWSAVAHIKELPGFLVVYVPSAMEIIPDRAFASPEAKAAFTEALRHHADSARLPEPERIRRYMAERDLPCPGCKYNLRGIATDACPECGRQLRYAELVS